MSLERRADESKPDIHGDNWASGFAVLSAVWRGIGSFLIGQMRLAPFCQFGEHRQKGFALFGQGIFHVWWDFIELFPMDNAQLL